jgi:hypothetical protein
MDHAMELTDEAVADASGRGWLTFRGQTLEDAADIRGRAGDAAGARTALLAARAAYEEKGNVVGFERVRRRLLKAP